MDTLNPKQEKFCQLYVQLGNASAAYRDAYSSKAKHESVNVEACKLLKRPNVALRVLELRDQLEEQALWKRIDSVKTLAEIARNGEKDSDKVNAVKAINSMHGWDAPVKVDNTHRVIDDGSHEW